MNDLFLEYLTENLDWINDDEDLLEYEEIEIELIYSEQNYEIS